MATRNDNRPDEQTPLLQSRPEAAIDDELGPPTGRLLLILAGPYVLSFLFAFDSTLVATLATPIANQFGSLALLSWLASSFFVANTASQPLAGRLSSLYGRRDSLLCAAFLLCAGNVLCALSDSASTVIVGRVIAGFGGGAIGPIATFIVGDLVPLRRRGLWHGSLNFWFGVGSSLGGPVGGFISDVLDWRAAFWIQVPVTVLAILLVWLFLPRFTGAPLSHESGSWRIKHVDIPGAVVLVLLLTSLLLSLSAGGNALPWTSAWVIIGLVLPVFLLPLLLYLETRHKFAIMPPRLFQNWNVVAACLVNFFISLARFGLFFYAPIFFFAQGYSNTQTGLRFIPESLAVTCSSLGAGYIMRWTGRYYLLNFLLATVSVATYAVIAFTFDAALPAWVPFVSFFFVGMGYAGMLSTTLIAFTAAVPQDDQAIVTSMSYVFRSVGSALSVTLSSLVFRALLTPNLSRRFGADSHGRHVVEVARTSVQAMRHLPQADRTLAVDAYLESLRGVWYLLLTCAALALAVSVVLKEHRLFKRMDRTDVNEEEESRTD